MQEFGTWRSLVARLLGVQEAVGSNPAVPTFLFNNLAHHSIPEIGLWVTFWVTLPSKNDRFTG